MKKYKIYAGYYELYITDKDLPLPRVFQCSFNTVKEVWEYIDKADEWTAIDEDVYHEMYGADALELDNPIGNVFKVDEQSGEIIILSKETAHLF